MLDILDIIKEKKCVGCTSCVNVCHQKALQMNVDEEGFQYPQWDNSKCVKCGLCDKVCPVLFREKKSFTQKNNLCYAARNKNADILMQSSSGGVFSALVTYVIDKNGVVFGVRYDEKMSVVHSFSETRDGCKSFRGSKYVQSDLTNVFLKVEEFLSQGRIVLFVGTPCQVEGLNLFIGNKNSNLITVDLICHSVASPKIFKEYIEYINKNQSDTLLNINMRYKAGPNGWGHKFDYSYEFVSGRKFVNLNGIVNWGIFYFGGMIKRPSCDYCCYCNNQRSGDITLADFWDDNKKRMDIYSHLGTSFVMINTKKGVEVFESIKKQLLYWSVDEGDVNQPRLVKLVKSSAKKREEFWKYYKRHGFEKTYKYFYTNSIYVKLQNIKSKILEVFS